MPICHFHVPDRFEDGRHEAMRDGLRRVGYDVRDGGCPGAPDDIGISWNLYGAALDLSRRAAQVGARWLVAEEAYLRRVRSVQHYALAIGGHNGSGSVRLGGPERFASWGVTFAPWRPYRDGAPILVCGQRGFGYSPMAMPDDWPARIAHRLRRTFPGAPLLFRPHPKRRRREPPAGVYDEVVDYEVPLAAQLPNVGLVVVWTSNAATEALLRGVPVLYHGPSLVTAGPAMRLNERRSVAVVGRHFELPDRLPAFRRLSWSQWSAHELATGEAFRWLLER